MAKALYLWSDQPVKGLQSDPFFYYFIIRKNISIISPKNLKTAVLSLENSSIADTRAQHFGVWCVSRVVLSRPLVRPDVSCQYVPSLNGEVESILLTHFLDYAEPSSVYDNNIYHEECLRCNACGVNLTGPSQKRARRFKNQIFCDLHFADVALMESSDFMQQLRSFKPQSLGCAVARRKSSTTLIFPLPPQACSGKRSIGKSTWIMLYRSIDRFYRSSTCWCFQALLNKICERRWNGGISKEKRKKRLSTQHSARWNWMTAVRRSGKSWSSWLYRNGPIGLRSNSPVFCLLYSGPLEKMMTVSPLFFGGRLETDNNN